MNRYAKLLSLRIIFSLAILTTIAKDFYCHAQNNHLGVMQFSNTYISSSPQILAFQRDSTGIIWIGTSEGLYSYDGYRYIRQYEPRHFSNVRIHSLCTKGDTMYLGTDNGLMTYNLKNGDYSIADNKMKVVRCLLADGADIIAGTVNGIYIYNTTSGKSQKKGNVNNAIYSLLKQSNSLLVGTISGLYEYNNGKTKEICIGESKRPLVNSMLADRIRKCLWIGTEGNLYRMDNNGMTRIEKLSGNSIKSIAMNGMNTIYIGTDNGLYTIDANGNTTTARHSSTNPRSIANNIVWALYVDKWQNLWAGTDNGISMTKGKSYFSYSTTDEMTGRNDGNCLQAILRDSRGRLWAGGSNGLISYKEGESTWYNQSDYNNHLTHNRIRRLYEDKDGDIWATTDHGVNHLNNSTGCFDNYIVYDNSGKYSTTWAYDILCDKNNRLWIASYMGGILVIDKSRLMKSGGKCIADYHINVSEHGLPDIHVGQLAFDRNGNIWAMMYEKGVAIIDAHNFHTTIIKNTTQSKCMSADKEGNIWIAFDDMVVKYAPNGKKLKEYAIDNNDGTELVRSICTVNGDAWVFIGNNCRIITQSGKCHDIIIPQLTPYSTFYCEENNTVYLGGNDCMLKMNAKTNINVMQEHNVFLSELLVNGKPHKGEKDLRATHAHKVTLEHNENNITFELTDLPYNNIPLQRYAYRLEGSDDQWRLIGGSNMKLTYNGLPYGGYRLIVKSLDDNGNPASEVYSLGITILPPWYLSIWAKIVYAILFVSLILWAMNFHLVRQRLKMEKKQKESAIQQLLSLIVNIDSVKLDYIYSSLLQYIYNKVGSNAAVEFATEQIEDMHIVRIKIGCNNLYLSPDPQDLQQLYVANYIKDYGGNISMASRDDSGCDIIVDLPYIPDNAKEEVDDEESEVKQIMKDSDEKLLNEVTKAIEVHLADSDFNVGRMQEELGIGGKLLSRKLKKMTDKTPVEYIRHVRLQKAAFMLKEGKFTVSEVMYKVGFNKPGYFSKCFHDTFGMTPSEFQKKQR